MNLEVPISQSQEPAGPAAHSKKIDLNFGNRRLKNRLNRSCDYGSGRSESGQVVVEYVLLLVASVVLAMLITRLMVGRDPGNPGFVISAWNSIVEEIGADKADDIRR
jgi:hypothetical protein